MAEQSYVQVDKDGRPTSFVGPEGVNILRMRTLLSGMKMELTGLRMTRGPLCRTRVRREYGLKGNPQSLIAQFEVLVREAEAAIEVRTPSAQTVEA